MATNPSQPPAGASPLHKRRKATLYDAVAGRVGYESFLSAGPKNEHSNSSTRAVPADEVLFRRAHAPIRYQEADIYDAGVRDLPPDQPLPGSDLLKTVHAYVADFYAAVEGGKAEGERGGKERRQVSSFRSFDETALLAMGVLLEEAARGALGETGDLALVEAEEEGKAGEGRVWIDGAWRSSVLRKGRVRRMGKGETKRERSRSVRSGRRGREG